MSSVRPEPSGPLPEFDRGSRSSIALTPSRASRTPIIEVALGFLSRSFVLLEVLWTSHLDLLVPFPSRRTTQSSGPKSATQRASVGSTEAASDQSTSV